MAAMKRFIVVMTTDAEEELNAIGDFITQDSRTRAAAVVLRLQKAICGLELMPARFPPAREAGQVLADLRQRVEGPYRIIFEIWESEVVVIGIRHAALRPMDL